MGRRNKNWRKNSNQNDKLLQLMDRLGDEIAISPDERLRMEMEAKSATGRIVDLISPLGKGQRVLLPSPPKAGKTTILQKISESVDANNPEVVQFALLVDERVEEVTDFRRNIPASVEASSIDQPPKSHVKTAEGTFKQALDLVFRGKDVLILMDSLTRLARAYNKTTHSSGRTLSGGLSAGALDRPRMLFGAARNIEGDGSLTVVASALIDTGSRMDEVIFQEFKGTGNCELVLDREVAERRIWPAVDIAASGTRQEQRLLNELERQKVPRLRRGLAEFDKVEAIKHLKKMVDQTDSNEELLNRI